MWVADNSDGKLYAYNLATKQCYLAQDFPLDAENANPSGIWSDGTTMWVVDIGDEKIFAYNQPLSGNALLESLELSDVYDEGTSTLFSSLRDNNPSHTDRTYVVYSTDSTTVTARPKDLNAGVKINPPDANTRLTGYQVNLAEGDNTIKIAVAAEDGAVKQYTINVARISGGCTPVKDFNDANLITMTTMDFSPSGLWGNDTTIYVADKEEDKIYAYNLTSKTHVSADGFNTLNVATNTIPNTPTNIAPWGIWSDADGSTM